MYEEGLPVLFSLLFAAVHSTSEVIVIHGFREIPEEIKVIFPFQRFNIDDLSFSERPFAYPFSTKFY